MSSGFTPSAVVDLSNERDWPANLGMLDWDMTQICFTKRSLLEFLKYAGVTVHPNFTNIQKLPRFARFGTLPSPVESTNQSSASGAAPSDTAASTFRPSRRVREVPGGAHTNIFGTDDDDVLASAPPRGGAQPAKTSAQPAPEQITAEQGTAEIAKVKESSSTDDVAPRSRRATSGVGSLWDAPDASERFRPTRRVRETPGGKDSISGLF